MQNRAKRGRWGGSHAGDAHRGAGRGHRSLPPFLNRASRSLTCSLLSSFTQSRRATQGISVFATVGKRSREGHEVPTEMRRLPVEAHRSRQRMPVRSTLKLMFAATAVTVAWPVQSVCAARHVAARGQPAARTAKRRRFAEYESDTNRGRGHCRLRREASIARRGGWRLCIRRGVGKSPDAPSALRANT
jgi:hypothetical protein